MSLSIFRQVILRRILYIQHAGSFGGSAISLLALIKGLDRSQFEPVVACIHPTESLLELYRGAGVETLYWPGIDDFMHSTGGWYPLYDPLALPQLVKRLLHFRASISSAEALIRHVQPDVVHLNSLVLPSCAIAARRCGVSLVWHIRESVEKGHLGVRKRWLGSLVKQLADEAVFISSDGRRLLVNNEMGVVIPNFVDFSFFNRETSGAPIRLELGLPPEAKVILFLGGRSPVKGIFPLLRAMPLVKRSVPEAHLLVAGGAYHFSGRLASRVARAVLPLVGYGTVAQRVDRLMDRHNLHDYVHMLEWRTDIPQLLAASDLLVFPSVEPHFARPVIEAGAMAKPVVASRIGGVEELVVDGETGLLVPPGDPQTQAEAIVRVLDSPEEARRMGECGYAQARNRFSLEENVGATVALYERVFGS